MNLSANKRKTWLINLIFIGACLAIFIFLWYAPPVTTPRLPADEIHQPFYEMERKEAELSCESCHNPAGPSPLPEEHPPTYRCLFCHKLQ